MAQIKVNSTTMRDKANTLKGIATSIKGFTDEMTNEIDRLRSAWEGEVAETTVNKFKGLAGSFQERFDTINKYADFLNNAADEWDRVNAENLNAANSQPSN